MPASQSLCGPFAVPTTNSLCNVAVLCTCMCPFPMYSLPFPPPSWRVCCVACPNLLRRQHCVVVVVLPGWNSCAEIAYTCVCVCFCFCFCVCVRCCRCHGMREMSTHTCNRMYANKKKPTRGNAHSRAQKKRVSLAQPIRLSSHSPCSNLCVSTCAVFFCANCIYVLIYMYV